MRGRFTRGRSNAERSTPARLALLALAAMSVGRCARDAARRGPSAANVTAAGGAQRAVTPVTDASVTDASDASVTDAQVLPWMTRLPAPVRGSLAERVEERVECGFEDGERVMVSGSRATLTLRAEDAQGPTVAWARTNGFARVVVELDAESEGCISAVTSDRGGLATIALPSEGWTVATVRAFASDGESGPFVMGVRAAAMGAPAERPEPIAPVAANEARAHWLLEERDDCSGDDCATRTLVIEGAGAQTLVSRAPALPNGCEAEPVASRRVLFAYGCSGGGFTSWTVERSGGDRYAVIESFTSHGQCGRPCPTHRTTLHRFTLPAGTRLVPDPLRLVERR
jgi:hypothetical protein